MNELLAPAGDYESLIAAISNGADAVYLGLTSLSARAYAKNFTLDELKTAVNYAHLRNVKIYVTMNTLIYEAELASVFALVNEAYLANVDGLIIQDLALLNHVIINYPLMEAHASTQVGIDDLQGIQILANMGVKRVVIARETPIEKIMEFKKKTKMPIEVFIHGALCVSYSGGCLMSGLIGMRSGNRGRCVGPCRKKYQMIDDNTKEVICNNYILSMKDLNTTHEIERLKNIDSLKIEGRMKSPEYVASIVRAYRHILDSDPLSDLELEKIFNRTFTKGYLFNEDKKNITNPERPNNNGYLVGKITGVKNHLYEITLNSLLTQGDQLRIEAKNEINIPALKIYDKKNNLIRSSSSIVYMELKEKALVGDLVYKTRDKLYMEEINKTYPNEYRRIPLDFYVEGQANEKLKLTISYNDIYATAETDTLDMAINKPVTKDILTKQLDKLTDTPYKLNNITFNITENFFIATSAINELRRNAIEDLNKKRLSERKQVIIDNCFSPITFTKKEPSLAVFVTTDEQYQVAMDMGIETIYYHNYAKRNNVNYEAVKGDYILVGNYGGIKYFQDKYLIADHHLNATNSLSVYNLYKLGVKRVTLPHEINRKQIIDLFTNYYDRNNGYPNLEMIVYGHQELFQTKYCPLKKNSLCGKCKTHNYYLDDGMYQFPILTHEDCNTSLLNGKILNLIDDLASLRDYINVFRLSFTIENKEETKRIIELFKEKLNHPNSKEKLFNEKTDTRGHFNRDVI